MGRTLLWVVVVAGLGAAGWFMFGASEEDAGDGGYAEVDLLGEGDTDAARPGLKGTGGGTADPLPTGPGAFTIRGTVRGLDGTPAADIEVLAYRDGKARDPQDPSTWGRSLDEAVAAVIARAEKTPEDRTPLAARSRTAPDGTFTLTLDQAGRYRVHAVPDAPAVCPYTHVSVHGRDPSGDAALTVIDGAALEGRVVDENDAPVACTVRATHHGTLGGTYRAWRGGPVTTDAETGAWRFDAVPRGTVRLALDLPDGRRISGYGVDVPHDGPFVIRLAGGKARARGRVTNSDDEPVAGALVVVQVSLKEPVGGSTPHVAIRTRSDATGAFALADVPEGKVTMLEAAAPGYLPYGRRAGSQGFEAIDVTTEAEATVDITLERGGVVVGRLTEKETETPIAGATIELLRRQGNQPGVSYRLEPVTTDAEGRYRVESVPKGTYVAFPQAEGYFLPQLAGMTQGSGAFVMAPGPGQGGPTELTVVVTGEGKEVTRDLSLGKGFELSGRVVDADGRGVSGAEIRARGFGMQQVGWQWGVGSRPDTPLATSGGDGRFKATGLPPRTNWVFFAKKEGYAGVFSTPLALDAETRPEPLELTLQQGAVLRGRVVGLDDASLAQAQVAFWGTNQELAAKSHGHKLAPDGTFELTGVPPGDWTLNVWVNGRQAPQRQIQGLEAGEVREDIVVTFAEGVVVSGRVVDSDGKPVERLNVVLNMRGRGGWHTTLTDSDGRFEFASASKGSAQVMAFGPNGRQIPLGKPFEAPAQDLEFTYDRPKTVVLRGEVTAANGTPIAVCTVQVTQGRSNPNRGMMPMPGGHARSRQEAINGVFEVMTTGNGPWTVTADAARGEDGKKLNLRRTQVVVNDPSSSVAVRMEAGARLEGRVVDADGKGLAGINVMAGSSSAMTGKDGRFTVDGLSDNRTIVQVNPPPGMVRPAPQQATPGKDDVEFRLIQGLSIKGKALGPDGKPLAQGHVSASWPKRADHPQGGANAQLESDGTFELKGLPPGTRARVQVQVWSTGGSVAYAPAIAEDVLAGTTDLELRLGGGHAIEGRVLTHDGKAPGQCYIYGRAKNGKKQTGWVQVGEDGTFRLGGLEPVAYDLNVMRQDGGAQPTSTTITPPARGVEIRLPRTVSFGGRIEGLGAAGAQGWQIRVTDAAGKQVAFARAAADGSWDVPAIADLDEVFVAALKTGDDRYGRAGPFKASTKNAVVRLQQGKSIAGTIEGGRIDGQIRASVWVEGADGWASQGMVRPDGTFTITGLPDGTYTVKANWFGADSQVIEEEGVAAGATGVRLDLR